MAMLFASLLLPGPLLAQDPADAPAAKIDADKAEGDKKAAPKKAAPARPVDPAVIAIHNSNPSTPRDLVRSIDAPGWPPRPGGGSAGTEQEVVVSFTLMGFT